ncbi:MAG: twin-arginine translocation signal domain-containing protein [Pyrinomonadaceae bacterium]
MSEQKSRRDFIRQTSAGAAALAAGGLLARQSVAAQAGGSNALTACRLPHRIP